MQSDVEEEEGVGGRGGGEEEGQETRRGCAAAAGVSNSRPQSSHQHSHASRSRPHSSHGHGSEAEASSSSSSSSSSCSPSQETQTVSPSHNPHSHLSQDPLSVVFSPRVPTGKSCHPNGLEDCDQDELRHKTTLSTSLMQDVLDKCGMTLKVPSFLQRMASNSSPDHQLAKTKGSSMKASTTSQKHKVHILTKTCGSSNSTSPQDPMMHPHHETHRLILSKGNMIRLKSGGSSLVTVPLNSKQWLLQALGLKDTELCELFHQMESIPQFAAEYVREVKDEWQALESRGMKKPPEAEYLLKDQALLEKIRGLIMRFVSINKPRELLAKQHESQTSKENEKTVSSGQSRSVHMHERNSVDIQDSLKLESDGMYAIEPTTLGEVDDVAVTETGQRLICTSCGQLKSNFSGSIPQCASSSLKRASTPQARHMLPSFIPVDDYIVKHCVLQPEISGKPEHKSRFSPHDKRWYTVLFPALQPGRREDVQLLGEWLQQSMHRNQYENSDGHFEDTEAVFLLHSIAFLEIVRQVDLHCEERGNLLLHVWRQLLRVFNQVMWSVEPFLNAKEEELVLAKNYMDTMREEINQLVNQLDESKKQVKEKDMQIHKMKRCRLCLCENMTPRSREDTVKRIKRKAAMHRRVSQIAHVEAKEAEMHRHASQPAHVEAKVEDVNEISQRSVLSNDPQNSQLSIGDNITTNISEDPHTDDVKDDSAHDLPSSHDGSMQEVNSNIFDPSQETHRLYSERLLADACTQTCEKTLKGHMRRSESAPILLKSSIADIKSSGRLPKDNTDERRLITKDLALDEHPKATEEDSFLKLLGPPGPGSMPIPGTIIGAAIDRLQNFEDLALETLGILEKIPNIEGISVLQNLRESYCKLTGHAVKQPEKERDCSLQSEVDSQQENELDSDKSKKKGQTKPIKTIQAKYFVPTSFSKMMKINTVPKNLKSFNARQASKLIASVYYSKIEADAVDDAANNARQTCSEFVYDFMLNLYGLKGIAESAIHGLFKTLKGLITSKQMEKQHKVRLFGKFVCMEGECFTELDLYLYLKALQKAMSKPCVILPSDQDDGFVFLNVTYLDYIIDDPNIVQFMGSEAATRETITKFAAKYTISEKASPEIKKLVKENDVKKLDWDHLMETILESRPRSQVEEKEETVEKTVKENIPLSEDTLQELVNLFIAGDANQDGVLTFTEFREIISTADPSITTQSALRMFRETLLLMPDGGDSISPQAFATVAHSHGISAPARVVFELLVKTWNQVQDDVNEEKMLEASQKKEFEGLKKSLLSLLAEKKNVTRAVQVFRDLVLKFCGKDEEETEEKDVTSGTDTGDA